MGGKKNLLSGLTVMLKGRGLHSASKIEKGSEVRLVLHSTVKLGSYEYGEGLWHKRRQGLGQRSEQ